MSDNIDELKNEELNIKDDNDKADALNDDEILDSIEEELEDLSDEVKNQVNLGLLAMAEEDLSEEDLKGVKRYHFKSIKELLAEITPRAWVGIVVWFVILIALFAIIGYKKIQTDSLYDQTAASRWTNKGSSQVSIYLVEGYKLDEMTIGNIRFNVKNTLDSFQSDSDNDDENDVNKLMGVEDVEVEARGLIERNKSLDGDYTYAYSGRGVINISSAYDETKSVTNASVIGVAGDFFVFHPVELYEGGRYFDSTEVMNDSVILDSNSASKLFGSTDCVGQTVLINNVPHYVRGVYECDYSTFSKAAGSDGGNIFMFYSSLEKNGTSFGISSIEFVGLEPYKGYLYNYLKDTKNNGLTEGSFVCVQNTDRFGWNSLIENVIKVWGKRSMQIQPFVYPFWENIARAYENVYAVVLLVEWILIAYLVLTFIIFWYHRFINRTLHFKEIQEWIEDRAEEARTRKIKARKAARKKR